MARWLIGGLLLGGGGWLIYRNRRQPGSRRRN
jgi:hypothetical protein